MKSPIIKKIDEYIYVSFTFLIENGFNKGTLNNLISKYRNGDSLAFITHKDSKSQKKFIQYKSIPLKHLQKHNLPSEEEDLEKILNSSLPKKLNSVTNRELDFTMEQTWLQKTYWVQYVPHYKDYFTDSEQIVLYSKTHAVIALILKCKGRNIWSMKDMFHSYMKLPKAIFKTSNLKYFYEKINDCNKKGIPETLVHDFRINGREPYKVIPIIKGVIKSYYVRKKCYSISKITTYVNTELGLRGLKKISESTVRNICNDLEFKNRADSIRYGNKYAENKLLPYLSRVNTREIGDQYQCDTCKVNFPYKSGNEVKFLRVCAVMDQYSRKIVGYSFGEVENTILILEAIRNTFNKNEVIPRQLLIDNHSSYHSILFKNFEALIEEYGVVVRKARVRNPKDKGNVEVWFDKFQTDLLKDLYGNLGAGVKTYTDGKRMEEDVINVYYDKKNLSTLNRLKNILEEKIQAYNSIFLKLVDSSPNNLFENRKKNNSIKKFTKPDISYLFDQYKKIKVKRSKIIFQVNGRKYHYTIWNRITANKLNRSIVKVYYNELNFKYINVFDMDNKYMAQLSLDPIVSAVPYTEGERKIYQKHRLRVVKMDRENIKSIYKESKKAVKELKSLPITSLNHEINDNLRRLEKEDEKLMFQVFDKVSHLKTLKKELKKDDQVYEPQIKNKRTKKYKLREIKNEITRK